MTPSPVDDFHEQHEDLAAGWVLHALEPAEAQEFAAHLADCSQCQQSVAEFEHALADLGPALSPPMEPAIELGRRIHALAVAESGIAASSDAERSVTPISIVHDTAPRKARRGRWVLAAAAALVVVMLGLGNVIQYRERHDIAQQLDSARTDAGQQAETAAKRADLLRLMTKPGVQATALVHDGRTVAYVVVQEGRVSVLTDGLAASDNATEYALWMFDEQDRRALLATFTIDDPALQLVATGADVPTDRSVAMYAVSREKASPTPPSVPTDVVATGAVAGR